MAASSIRSVYLEDFQSHDKTKIELAPAGGLTVIVGPTDSGKTAIVRGLRLLMYNVPQGTDYIRVGRSTATVAVEMSDGTKVARERSKSVNRYRIARPGQSPQVFEGFGLSVPLEVQDATGVRTVSIGDTLELALNLSEQLDGPFLGKAVSGPAKAKILGALAGTEEVDEAQRAVGLDLHRAGQDESRLADEIRTLDAKIAEYDYLPRLAEQISALESILTSVKEVQRRLSDLESAKAKLEGIDSQKTQALSVLVRWGGLYEATFHVESAESALIKMQTLSGLRSSLASIAAQRGEWETRLTRWANLDTAEACASVCSDALSKLDRLYGLSQQIDRVAVDKAACFWTLRRLVGHADAEAVVSTIPDLTVRLVALGQHADALTRIRQARVVAEADLDRHTKALGDAQSLYVDTLIQLGTCPLCGSAVDPESISLHIKEVA